MTEKEVCWKNENEGISLEVLMKKACIKKVCQVITQIRESLSRKSLQWSLQDLHLFPKR